MALKRYANRQARFLTVKVDEVERAFAIGRATGNLSAPSGGQPCTLGKRDRDCRAEIERLPREVAEVDAMPLAATGKIDKVRLRADYADGTLVAEPA